MYLHVAIHYLNKKGKDAESKNKKKRVQLSQKMRLEQSRKFSWDGLMIEARFEWGLEG